MGISREGCLDLMATAISGIEDVISVILESGMLTVRDHEQLNQLRAALTNFKINTFNPSSGETEETER